jgi:8-oxo-dGTP diphosphatase
MFERGGAHGSGTWSVPGGHIEFDEDWIECAKREAMEEVGLKIKNVKLLTLTNDVFTEEKKHYITIWMTADWDEGEPESKEPEKVTDLAWHSLHDLPEKLFEPCWTNLRAAVPEFFA